MANILIVDDDAALRESIAETLADLGHRTIAVPDGATALAAAASEPVDAVLLDLRIPGLSGLEVLARLRDAPERAPPVAILTAYASPGNTIEAMRLGAFDHLTKPIARDDLIALVARMLRPRAAPLTAQAQGEDAPLIGASEAMRAVQKLIGLVADSDATVLITGETGTGKEVVARAIHRHGRRAAGPFVAVNCAAIPRELIESELFGHARGAFSGAVGERRGAFRDADRGTLLLDEIGDMDLALQAKILRALQERVVTPVGGRPVPVDVRIIAATHRRLADTVRDGQFREDLFYRLNVLAIELAPLRQRLSDIVPLAEQLLRQAGALDKRLTADAAARLIAHPWPGNVRELRNAMERVAILCRSDTIAAADLAFLSPPTDAPTAEPVDGDLPGAVARLEATMIARALAACDGNRAEAARRLGIHRQLLYAKAQKYGIAITALSAGRTAPS